MGDIIHFTRVLYAYAYAVVVPKKILVRICYFIQHYGKFASNSEYISVMGIISKVPFACQKLSLVIQPLDPEYSYQSIATLAWVRAIRRETHIN